MGHNVGYPDANVTTAKDDGYPNTPASYANWKSHDLGIPSHVGWEYPLYSDARLTGEVTTGLGPYAFFNPVALRFERGFIRPAAVLRLSVHVQNREISMESATSGSYHGGDMTDELAALASLLVGVRFRAGAASRRFGAAADAAGRPVAWDMQDVPVLPIDVYGVILPEAEGDHSLMTLEDLQLLPKLRGDDAVALVRAARLHQDALWVAESEPNLAWIMMVSAVETAANQWRRGKDTPVAKLRGSKPALVSYLEGTQVPGLPERIAGEFAGTLGSTAKFVDFLVEHLPPPPEVRPLTWGQVEWTDESLEKAFRTIYGHRSKALHEGIPFPAPLCRPVVNPAHATIALERPGNLVRASELGGVWYEKDLPIYLHTFCYIARLASISWWRKCAG